MVRRHERRMKRISRRVPGGNVRLRFKKKKVNKARCSICGKTLHGVITGRKIELSKLSKTEKRPNRPFAGVLCSSCMRERLKDKLMREVVECLK